MRNTLHVILVLMLLAACGGKETADSAAAESNAATESTAPASTEAPRQTLEEAVDNGGTEAFMVSAMAHARASVGITTLDAINAELRPHDRLFKPEGDGPFPAVLFFHGCSGPTASHEDDWAEFYNSINVVMIAVDSYAGRGIDWNDACNAKAMTPWQRAADVLATVAYARTLDYVDSDALVLSGFSHGAMTIWQSQVFASTKEAPISLASWPEGAMDGVRLSFPFYGTCTNRWTAPISTTAFLGDNDRYIDEQSCIDYAAANNDVKGSDGEPLFSYRVFEGATHTFDHARPNKANVDAGSVYDAAATTEAQQTIAAAIAQLRK